MTKNRFQRNALFISAGLLSAASVGAQDSANPDQAEELAPIQVEGGAVDSAAQQANQLKRASPNAVEIIGDDQLNQYNEQALGDALRRVPSVSFDGANRTREIRLRGLPSKYTQVLVNGQPFLGGESNRTIEVDRIPTGLVERVEVVRSPRASQRGQGASGTVNIVLKDGAELPEQTEITVGAGYLEDTGNLGELGVTHVGKNGPLSYTFAASVQQFRRSETANEFEFDANRDPDGGKLEFNQRKFEQINLMPSFQLDLRNGGELSFSPFYTRTKEFRTDIERKLEDDQQTIKESANEGRVRPREQFGFQSEWKQSLTQTTDLSLGLNWQEAEVITERTERGFENDVGSDVSSLKLRDESRDLELIRPEATLSIDAGRHALAFGVGAGFKQHDESNSEVEIESGEPVEQKVKGARVFQVNEDVLFGYVEDVWAATDRFRITGGLRYEQSDTETTSFAGDTISEDVGFVLPSVNAAFDITSQTQLRAGVSRSVRRPDLRSLTPTIEEKDGVPTDPDEQGNPDQEPESIWGIDTGVDHYFAQGRGYVSANAFYRLFEDKIEQVVFDRDPSSPADTFTIQPRNVGDGRAAGLELSGRVPLTALALDDVTLWGNATYTDTSVDEEDGGSRRFLNQPDFSTNVGIDYYVPAWKTTLGLSVNHVDSVDLSQSIRGGGSLERSIDSRTRLDLSARTEISQSLSLSVSATNLTNETEGRETEVFDGNGQLSSVERAVEPTYQQVFARLNWRF